MRFSPVQYGDIYLSIEINKVWRSVHKSHGETTKAPVKSGDITHVHVVFRVTEFIPVQIPGLH